MSYLPSSPNLNSFGGMLAKYPRRGMVQRYAHLAPEHLAKFAGNAKVAKSVAGKNGINEK